LVGYKRNSPACLSQLQTTQFTAHWEGWFQWDSLRSSCQADYSTWTSYIHTKTCCDWDFPTTWLQHTGHDFHYIYSIFI